MATYTCPYSGLELQAPYVPLHLPSKTLAHPIFYATHQQLEKLYLRFSKGTLDAKSSYLLFLALLNETGMVHWQDACTYKGAQTDKIIISNMHALITVIWETAIIQHPGFKQTGYIFSEANDNLDLSAVSAWIATWQNNIADFKDGYVTSIEREKLAKVEAQVERIILSGAKEVTLAVAVSRWAAVAGAFPKDKAEEWKKIIRKCYNHEAMFSTPRSELIALKEYCEMNIEAGTVHFHSLMKVLSDGISNHDDFLGIDVPKASETNYQLLPEDATQEEVAIAALIQEAPKEKPIERNYPSKIAYLRAKLKWEAAQRHLASASKESSHD